MNVLSVLKTLGAAALSTHPLGVAALPIINTFLPKDKQLPETASGEQAEQAIHGLSQDDQKQILLADIQLDIEEEKGRTARYQAMCSADGQETRAKIVNKAMNTLILLSLIFVGSTALVYIKDGAQAAFSLEMAAVFGTVTATFAYVVRSYMGDLRVETTSRHALADDKPQSPKGLAGLLSALKGR